uniref:Uncharacterized protein n=1 Tax=Rhizophora mucronata TaxID=61149 RepID=A0A2P2JH17_RHIMU
MKNLVISNSYMFDFFFLN